MKSSYGKSPRSAADDEATREQWGKALGKGTRESGTFVYCRKHERVEKRGDRDSCS